MAVLVQRMSRPVVAGVLFTRAVGPKGEDDDRILVEAVAGSGDALVDGHDEVSSDLVAELVVKRGLHGRGEDGGGRDQRDSDGECQCGDGSALGVSRRVGTGDLTDGSPDGDERTSQEAGQGCGAYRTQDDNGHQEESS